MLAPVDRLPLRLDASQRARLRERLADETIAMLCEAVAAGFSDVTRLSGEPLFAPIRDTAAFRAIIATRELPRDVFAPP